MGGLNIQLHAIVDGLGNPVTFLLSAGNDHDSAHAVQPLEQATIIGSNTLQTGLIHSGLYLGTWGQICNPSNKQIPWALGQLIGTYTRSVI